ncbi:MAG: preprotein translocase subunit SecG [Candidatus Amulumruptor caecigallinarius]|nr:preprotein translocase subunit SecG [Candidatus Amulumruptor caecigallinarius]
MYIFFSILIVIACILLIGAVLIQKSKGGGLASDYSSGNQYLGYRKTTDFIEKATWTLAIVICLCSIFASFCVKSPVNVSSITPAAAPVPNNAAPAASQLPAAPAQKAPAAAPAQKTPAAAPAPAAVPQK